MISARSLERQQAILDYMQAFQDQHGYAPTMRQIQRQLKLASIATVAYHVDALETQGMLRRTGRHARNLTLIPDRPHQAIPLIGALTPDQTFAPSFAAALDAADTVTLPPTAIPATQLDGVYALRVRGTHLHEALLMDGDIVLMELQQTAATGDLVAVQIGDARGVRLLRWADQGDHVRLQPPNPTLPSLFVPRTHVQVRGRVVGVLRALL
jgi:repressor LexA